MDSSVLIRDQFKSFLFSKKAYGTADKTLATYEQHFSAISKHLDVNKPIDFLCKKDLQKMIADIRNLKHHDCVFPVDADGGVCC